LTCLLVNFYCSGQKNYHEGYIVTLDGDTTRGSVHHQNWDINPGKISFKKNEQSEPAIHTPSTIKGFFVLGELYQSATVDVDTSPHRVSDLDGSPLPTFSKDTVFLLVLFRGEKSLFYFKDLNAKPHFYIQENVYEPLIYKQYLTSVSRLDGYERKVGENLKYKGQLNYYLQQCPDIQKGLKTLKYQPSGMIKLYNFYYKCAGKSPDYVNVRNPGKSSLSAFAGIVLANFELGSKSGFSYLKLQPSNSLIVGISHHYAFPRASSLILRNELSYTGVKTTASHSKGGRGSIASTTVASINLAYLKTHHFFCYDIARNGLMFIGAGLSTGLLVNEQTSVVESYSTGVKSEREFKTKGHELGYVAVVGSNFGRFGLEARYDRSDGIINFSSTKRLIFLLRYSFI
jgi:hypothetical protein